MSRSATLPQVDPRNKALRALVELIRGEVRRRHGTGLTFEQRRDFAVEVVHETLWLDEEEDLQGLVTHSREVEVEGRRYRRLRQRSSGTYPGRWGAHFVEEALYRQVGVHNGPTIKPIELRAGIVGHMTPDLARIVGELSAHGGSREVEASLRTVGLSPPSRAFLEKRSKQMAVEMSEQIEQLEEAARKASPPPRDVAFVSCGMDRGAVRMVEAADPATARPRRRTEPYERAPPPPCELHYRMAWNGSLTMYDELGLPLRTLRYAAEANAGPDELARRISADVAWLLRGDPNIEVQCIQDGAPELRALPRRLRMLPANTQVSEWIDLEHLMGYLGNVVDAWQPPGDPYDFKGFYRALLLSDDDAIERIWQQLNNLAKALPAGADDQRAVVDEAITYIGKRKHLMRYASRRARGLPVGSGATENTVWLMQARVKRAGQSWRIPGLRGILTIRGLVLSDRWPDAWSTYAAVHRKEVRDAA